MNDHFYVCERCGERVPTDSYYEDDDEDEPLCYDCLQARLQQATVYDYSYTSRLIFHGELVTSASSVLSWRSTATARAARMPVKS